MHNIYIHTVDFTEVYLSTANFKSVWVWHHQNTKKCISVLVRPAHL